MSLRGSMRVRVRTEFRIPYPVPGTCMVRRVQTDSKSTVSLIRSAFPVSSVVKCFAAPFDYGNVFLFRIWLALHFYETCFCWSGTHIWIKFIESRVYYTKTIIIVVLILASLSDPILSHTDLISEQFWVPVLQLESDNFRSIAHW